LTPADNVLYFNNDIDVRLCLKNGFTSLRWLWSNVYKEQLLNNYLDAHLFIKDGIMRPNGCSTVVRYNEAMKFQDIWDIPFRRNSYRIAIKRDPIERFLSTVNYLDKVNMYDKDNPFKKKYISLEDVDRSDINKVLDAFDNQTLRDEHFFSQSYFMGHPNDYDKVYYLSELDELIQWLCKKCNYVYIPVKFNQSEGDYPILTSEQQLRIIKMYAKDYANGWY